MRQRIQWFGQFLQTNFTETELILMISFLFYRPAVFIRMSASGLT
ncbi:Uncharacterized protein dnm_100500 [Desulfonema magnum]|uniref:Uncharacterized protein n=1 Tax=Desulfonema magnum TaxID=45655 RepID=A0A975BJU1_9BACT|nr:Uncharacterized protein dnm_029600 [Desulfonema magnum]QTA87019.1 Uncharacterized protein dnm_030460 [Desulfonema magnum]QTA91236.1 Uncharacterized protein dnm_073000 [Desulfonema magnum]QTA92244.1 Uncharacterized protein dnm_083200 [Desulfonema magnum]QTA93941.1 Uncharacterized protein dnm_100500 [Desulfonema magnum]